MAGPLAMNADRRAALPRALATVPEERRASWRGYWRAHPYMLDVGVECPTCEAKPFRPCRTRSGYTAKLHAPRREKAGLA